MRAVSFQPLDFSSRLDDYRRRVDEDEQNVFKNINSFVSSVGQVEDAYNAKQEDKRKWEQLLDEQRYSRERDRIADERYNAQWAERQQMQAAQDAALRARKKNLADVYGEGDDFRSKYGDAAYIAYQGARTAPTLSDMIASESNLSNAISFYNQAEAMKAERQATRKAEEDAQLGQRTLSDVDSFLASSNLNISKIPSWGLKSIPKGEAADIEQTLLGQWNALDAVPAELRTPELNKRMLDLYSGISRLREIQGYTPKQYGF